jgi:hypothetical protein
MRVGVCVISAIAGLLALGSSAMARDNSTSQPDVITICYASATVCFDACDKAVMTGSEWARCERNCTAALENCRSSARRKGTTGVNTRLAPAKQRQSN